MSIPFRRSLLAAATGAAVVLVGVPAATASASITVSTPPRIVAHFDLAAGQTAENFAVEPDGSTDVTFAVANQVAHVSRDGAVSVIAQLPPGGKCDIFPGAATLGIARDHDGTLYVVECAADSDTGVWRIRPGAAPVQIAELAPDGLPNGMALDDRTGDLYVSDSLLGEVWRVPTRGGAPSVWAGGPELQEVSFAGANGLAVHNGSVWVGNTDKGLIARIPIRADGTAGPIQTVVTGVAGIDDFTVVGHDDTILAALNFSSQVIAVRPGGQPRLLLMATDGLSNPTAVRVRDGLMYVTSAAYFASATDPTDPGPNLLVTRFEP